MHFKENIIATIEQKLRSKGGHDDVALLKDDRSFRVGGVNVSTEKNFNTTDKGYVNKNGQLNQGRSNVASNHYNQTNFAMRCGRCGFEYTANGCDIWLRKCPNCQGGAR